MTVNMSNQIYEPGTITVPQGTTVEWVNKDEDEHTVTSVKDTSQVLNSPTIKQNETFEYTFTEKGTFPYFCQVHDYMTGAVVVE